LVPLESNSYVFLTFFNFNNFDKYVPSLIAVIFLIMLSAFFKSMETVFSTVNIIRLKNSLEEKERGAKKALYIAEKYELTLTTTLVGNTLANILAITLFMRVAMYVIVNDNFAVLIATVILFIVILLFGEIIPKVNGKEKAEKMALSFSGLMYLFIIILFPTTFVFLKIKKLFFKNANDLTPYVTEDELESIIDTMETKGVIEKNNAELIQSAISLNERNVCDIMTPRVDVVAIEITESAEDIKNMFFEYQFSRVPVYEEDKDNIIGVLSERDFLTAYIKNNGKDIEIKKLMSKPFFVSRSKKVDDLIREMQQMKKHFAIVSDEYGGTSGIVTMEDALEELVGEIYDEFDEYIEEEDTEKIVELAPGKYLVSADMEIDYLFEQLNLGEAPETRFSNLGGLVYEFSEELPSPGKQVIINSVYDNEDVENPIHNEYEITFTIDKVENRRIKTIVVEPKIISEQIEEEEE